MKSNIGNLDLQNLKPWQRRGILLLGAILGGLAAYGLLRWLKRRQKGYAQTEAEQRSV